MNRGNTANAVNVSSGFQRSFLIFSNEDGGYEAGQKPSGHIKLEVREGRGKLHAAVQNLRPGNGRFVYKLYLLKSGESVAAYVGQLTPEPNKAELDWSFSPRNVGESGSAVGEFDIAAVLVEYADRPFETVICPLAAYKNRRTEWRNGLRTALMKKRFEEVAELHLEPKEELVEEPVNEEIFEQPAEILKSGYEEFHENKLPLQQEYTVQEYAPFEQILPDINQEQIMNGHIPQENDSYEGISPEPAIPEQIQKGYVQPEPIIPEQIQKGYIQPEPIIPEQIQNGYIQPEPIIPEQIQNGYIQPEPIIPEQIQNGYIQPEPSTQDQTQQDYIPPETATQQQEAQYQTVPGKVDTGCVYLNGNMCGAFVNNSAGDANPCAACHLHHGRPYYTEPPAGDVSQLREELDRYFEQCDPFHSNRSDYMWWRVGNPVNLNNLLYQCNIRSPLLFNPAVMMAHYKYRHLIVGIFLHRDREKQYVVCGVPGMSMVDKKPFGDMSRWVQAEGNRPRYGAFGYWLVYIDPEGGKILNMGQE